ncbi:hypothetical protein QAD02_017596 [Eretmocerus hayati]|uniref:Uncharacterized protein n=1 Tax=Eretmocerus hayati TaxID=131215 RepID=A0ACC2PDZ9_9HYME|nr:hypothetical protein QAD02_017596 [Eretmocerus hayati]
MGDECISAASQADGESHVFNVTAKICFLCRSQDTEIKNFEKNTLSKCNYSSLIRKHFEFQYHEVVLPKKISGNIAYHKACYSTFNSIKKFYFERFDAETNSLDQSTELSGLEVKASHEKVPETLESGKNSNDVCLYCRQKNKTVNQKREKLSKTTVYAIFDNHVVFARQTNDTEFLQLLDARKSKELPILYHRCCERRYELDNRAKVKPKNTEWHFVRKLRDKSFKFICKFVDNNIIKSKGCFFLKFIERMFADTLKEEFEKADLKKESIFTKDLEEDLKGYFKNKIRFIQCDSRTVIAPHDIKIINNFESLKKDNTLRKAANELRTLILNMKIKPLPQQICVNHLKEGECDIPEELMTFSLVLFRGQNFTRKTSDSLIFKAKSLASDIIFNVTKGVVKPSISIRLGMAVKSLKNSKQLVNLLNRSGHCVNYSALEEFETELAYTSLARSALCPNNILLRNDLNTGVAWDNFDRFVETATGRDTLHCTNGIIYQNKCHDNLNDPAGDSTESSTNRKRRRSFKGCDNEIPPYPKKLKLIGHFHTPSSADDVPEHLEKVKKYDFLWELSYLL